MLLYLSLLLAVAPRFVIDLDTYDRDAIASKRC